MIKAMSSPPKSITRRKFLTSLAGGTFGLGLGCVGYGWLWEPYWLEADRDEVLLPNISVETPITILHLSDLHASKEVPFGFLENAIQIGLNYQPDLICLTGDFITDFVPDIDEFQRILSKLSAAAPTFACLGNHDGGRWSQKQGGYHHTQVIQTLLKASGIACLSNQSETLSLRRQPFRIVGFPDIWSGALAPWRVLEQKVPSCPTIVLAHNPDTKDHIKTYQWNLMLSGHTHGGQVRFPLLGAPFAPVRDRRFIEGLHAWEGRWLHITRGIGNMHGIRFNCRPELSLLEVKPLV